MRSAVSKLMATIRGQLKIHHWHYTDDHTVRTCRVCGRCEKFFGPPREETLAGWWYIAQDGDHEITPCGPKDTPWNRIRTNYE